MTYTEDQQRSWERALTRAGVKWHNMHDCPSSHRDDWDYCDRSGELHCPAIGKAEAVVAMLEWYALHLDPLPLMIWHSQGVWHAGNAVADALSVALAAAVNALP